MPRTPSNVTKTLFGLFLYFLSGFFHVLADAMSGVFATHDSQRVNGQHQCQYRLFHMFVSPYPQRALEFPYFPLLPVREILSLAGESVRRAICPRSSLRPRACSRVEVRGLFCPLRRLLRGSPCR